MWYPVGCPKAVLPGRLSSGLFLFLFGILCSFATSFHSLILSLFVPFSHLVAKLPLSWWDMRLSVTLFLSYLPSSPGVVLKVIATEIPATIVKYKKSVSFFPLYLNVLQTLYFLFCTMPHAFLIVKT